MDAQTLVWDDLRFFLALVRGGSLSRAGQALGVEHSTVLRRIEGLERRLDVRLFDRMPRGYAMTQVANDLLPIAQRVEEEVFALERLAHGSDQTLRGRICVTSVDDIAQLICPHLRSFQQRFPAVRLELVSGREILPLHERAADVSIRPIVGKPTRDDVVIKTICPIMQAPYASRRYIAEHGRPRRRRDLAKHRVVAGTDELQFIAPLRWITDNVPAENIVYRTNSYVRMLEAIEEDFGIGIINCFLGDLSPDVVRLFKPQDQDATLSIVFHRDLRSNARIRAFIDHMCDALETDRDLIEGRRPRSPRRTSARAR